MKSVAAVLCGPRDIRVEEFDLPDVHDDDGVLRVEACGVCGSDARPFKTGHATEEGGPTGPVILGHEIVGRVERLGRNARRRWGLDEGDRIVLERQIPCGRCWFCRSGDYRLCQRVAEPDPHLRYGSTTTHYSPGLWGGYATHLYLHPDAVVYRAPESVVASELTMFMPLANAVSWIETTGRLPLGGTVLILGPGQQGLAAAMVARAIGAAHVVVTGLASDAQRLKIAEQVGATGTIVVEGKSRDEITSEFLGLTGGGRADVVLDTAATASTEPVSLACDLAGHGGRVIIAARHSTDDGRGVDWLDKIWRKGLKVQTVRGRAPGSAARSLDLIGSGQMSLDSFSKRACDLETVGAALNDVVDRQTLEVHTVVIP